MAKWVFAWVDHITVDWLILYIILDILSTISYGPYEFMERSSKYISMFCWRLVTVMLAAKLYWWLYMGDSFKMLVVESMTFQWKNCHQHFKFVTKTNCLHHSSPTSTEIFLFWGSISKLYKRIWHPFRSEQTILTGFWYSPTVPYLFWLNNEVMTSRGERHVIIVTCVRQQCHMFCHMRNLSQIRFVNFQHDKSIIVVHVIVCKW